MIPFVDAFALYFVRRLQWRHRHAHGCVSPCPRAGAFITSEMIRLRLWKLDRFKGG